MLALLLSALLAVDCVYGHAVYLTQSGYCGRQLSAGSNLMNMNAVADTSRSVVVKRGSTTLSSGSSYVFGEVLTVSLSSTAGGVEYVFSVQNGVFAGGGCSRTRVADSAATVTAPSSGSGDLKVVAGWSSGQFTPVRITSTFTLKAPAATSVSPSKAPSLRPTAVPTSAPVSGTAAPSRIPTVTPTAPTAAPSSAAPIASSQPSSQPSSRPSQATAAAETASYTVYGLSAEPTAVKVGLGVLIGVLSAAALLFTGYWWAAGAAPSENEGAGARDGNMSFGLALAAAVMAIVCLALVSKWASARSSSEDYGYLGRPSWESNVFAWHPVLMVAGFFGCQVLAIGAWSLLPTHSSAKVAHAVTQLIGMACMIAGFWAVLKDKLDRKAPGFTTMHSYVGIVAICLHGLTFAWGLAMALLTAFCPASVLRQAYDLRAAHRALGLLTFWMTNAAVLSGIMAQLPTGSCYWPADGQRPADTDPAAHFPDTPSWCKVAHGLGVCVLVASTLLFLAVTYRLSDDSGSAPVSFERAPSSPNSPDGRGTMAIAVKDRRQVGHL